MAKDEFLIQRITRKACLPVLFEFHYLKDISKSFRSGIYYGLIKNEVVVGVVVYTGFPVPELVKGMFGLERDQQAGFFELSRLCVKPSVQSSEHNITSWFVSRTLKDMAKNNKARAILSYADSEFHQGTIYKACNFKYYGLSEQKKDFFIKKEDGKTEKHSRGKIKGIEGEWKDRSQKHRFLITFDKSLKILWKEEDYK